MSLETSFEIMLRSIVKELHLLIINTRSGYLVSNGKDSVLFIALVEQSGKLKILMNPKRGKIIGFGSYTQKELTEENSKARRAVIASLQNPEYL